MLARLEALRANPHKHALLHATRGSLRALAAGALGDVTLEDNLLASYRWLCSAQDATPDGGVSGFFHLWSGRWSAPYPETTGYIIPTFLALARARGDEEARERALRMTDWSCDVQMRDGAVLSGLLGAPRGPAVFNTGQGIFGWIAAYEATGRERYAEAARRAAAWLLEHQDPDGAWRRELSMVTTASVHTYNVRCAWALAYASRVLGEPTFADAARQACEWALAQQNDLGWFTHNAFSDGEVPLLHTIAYVLEGLIGVYAFTGERRYLEGGRRAADCIVRLARHGKLAGRLDERWRPTVSWRCPSGDAQIAVVLQRLHGELPRNGYRDVARQLTAEVARIQLALGGGRVRGRDGGPSVGGVPGSWPVWGSYMRLALPNWAAKFFLDALLLETRGVDEVSFPRRGEHV